VKYDPQKHHRRSIRLKEYDYTQPGAYFITLVTYQRSYLFGKIVNGVIQLSPMGQIADEHWREIPDHFPQAKLGTYVIMPNHVHGIIILKAPGRGTTVSCPDLERPTTHEQFQRPVAGSIPTIIRSYKASVTYRIQKELNSTGIWQRNYYEHIIRNDQDYNRIHRYIETNASNWDRDDQNLTILTANS
jgi:REP element-mobilizing transposase RayT